MAKKKLYQITQAKLEEFKREYDEINTVTLPQVLEALKEAKQLGDLSENSEYTKALNDQKKLDGRLAQLEEYLNNYEIVKEESITVKYLDLDKTVVIDIVGSIGSDPLNEKGPKITTLSPLAVALKGKKPGDEVTFKNDRGKDVRVQLIEGNF